MPQQPGRSSIELSVMSSTTTHRLIGIGKHDPHSWQHHACCHRVRCTSLVSYLPFVGAAVISPRPGRISDSVLLKQSRAAVKRANARLMRVRPTGALLFSCENTDRDLILTFLLAVSGKRTSLMHNNNQVFWSLRRVTDS